MKLELSLHTIICGRTRKNIRLIESASNTAIYFPPLVAEHTNAQALAVETAGNTVRFGAGRVAESLGDEVTHVVVSSALSPAQVGEIRGMIAGRRRVPRIVRLEWVGKCWGERTRLDEEGFAVA